MKKIFILITLYFSFTTQAFAAWAIVQKVNASGVTSGGTATISATASGNSLIIILNLANNGAVSSISDGGDTFASSGSISARSSARGEIWYAENILSGKTSIVPTFSGGNPGNLYIYEVSGLAKSSSLDTSNHVDNQTASTTPLGAAVTTTAIGDFIVSFGESAGSITGVRSGNEFTSDQLQSGNNYAHITSTSATAGSHQPQWDSDNSAYSSVTAAFKLPQSNALFNSTLYNSTLYKT